MSTMKGSLTLLGVCFASAVLGGQVLRADSISNLYNTGVNQSGSPLANGTEGDPHYSLISVPPTSSTQTLVRTSAGGYPIGPWLGDDTLSAWIGPDNDFDASGVSGPAGTYHYQTTFTLASDADLSTARITGQWAVDDGGTDDQIWLNNIEVASGNSGFASWTKFAIDYGFLPGSNTLDFYTVNGGFGPTGLRVEMSGTYGVLPPRGTAAPIPLSAGAGVALMGVLALRRLPGLRREM